MKCEDGCLGNRVLSVQQVASVLNLEFLTDPILLLGMVREREVARFRGWIAVEVKKGAFKWIGGKV